MEKAASPRRQTSTRVLPRKESVREESPTTAAIHEEEEDAAEGLLPSSSSSSSSPPVASSSAASSSPIIDRSVRTRDLGRITLLLPSSSTQDTDAECQRGWRSPHGEPYRPLGNPELSLKLTPRLPKDPPSAASPRYHVPSSPSSSSSSKDTSEGVRAPSSPPPVDVLAMFPRDLRKRSGGDRDVKLALRLQHSIAQYSPDKVQRLRVSNHVTITRVGGGGDSGGGGGGEEEGEEEEDVHTALLRLQQSQQQQHRGGLSSPPPLSVSPRYHVEHGDTSFLRLRGAIHEGSSRLRLVRNGLSLLANVPSSEAIDLAPLQRHYLAARHRFLLSQADAKLKFPTPSRLAKAEDADDDTDGGGGGGGEDHHNHHPPGHYTESPVYLPYTTRQPQASPFTQLPTLAEFKARAREERLPRRTLASSRMSVVPQSPRKPTRASRLIAPFPPRSPPSPPPPLLHRHESRRGSVVLTPGEDAYDADTDALTRAIALASSSSSSPSSPLLHSVVRLQASVDALENSKDAHATTLARTLTILAQDRRDCLTLKAKHLSVAHADPLGDVERMRASAEAERTDAAASNLARFHWYPELLKLLLFHRDPPPLPLHPAESFCVDVIRRVASEGHAFEWPQLALLLTLLHHDDLGLPSVQCILTFLKRAVRVHPDDWAGFFQTHPDKPEPVELFKHHDAKQRDKRRQQRLAKLRSVVTINAVLRRITTPVTTPS